MDDVTWAASDSQREAFAEAIADVHTAIAGQSASLQMKGAADRSGPTTQAPSALQNMARVGVSGSGATLPHQARIQAAFGRHRVDDIQAHTDKRATEASRGLGARAYAMGNAVAFASQPDLHTAAHEAAHVLQQRAGISIPGGIGRAGDAYERHADAVADMVVRGGDASPLLDAFGARGSGSTSAVQRKPAEDGADLETPMEGELSVPDRACEEVQDEPADARLVGEIQHELNLCELARVAALEDVRDALKEVDPPGSEWLFNLAVDLAIGAVTGYVGSLLSQVVDAGFSKLKSYSEATTGKEKRAALMDNAATSVAKGGVSSAYGAGVAKAKSELAGSRGGGSPETKKGDEPRFHLPNPVDAFIRRQRDALLLPENSLSGLVPWPDLQRSKAIALHTKQQLTNLKAKITDRQSFASLDAWIRVSHLDRTPGMQADGTYEDGAPTLKDLEREKALLTVTLNCEYMPPHQISSLEHATLKLDGVGQAARDNITNRHSLADIDVPQRIQVAMEWSNHLGGLFYDVVQALAEVAIKHDGGRILAFDYNAHGENLLKEIGAGKKLDDPDTEAHALIRVGAEKLVRIARTRSTRGLS